MKKSLFFTILLLFAFCVFSFAVSNPAEACREHGGHSMKKANNSQNGHFNRSELGNYNNFDQHCDQRQNHNEQGLKNYPDRLEVKMDIREDKFDRIEDRRDDHEYLINKGNRSLDRYEDLMDRHKYRFDSRKDGHDMRENRIDHRGKLHNRHKNRMNGGKNKFNKRFF